MAIRCGEQLAAALKGEADPLQLLFPGGDTDAVTVYTGTPVARTLNALCGELVAAAVKQLPPGQRVRILEVGGGTGATTASVLPVLSAHQTEYVFTDLGQSFVSRAARKFSAYPFVRFRTLDIDRDPLAQEFVAGEFDLVIASNVVHATADVRATL